MKDRLFLLSIAASCSLHLLMLSSDFGLVRQSFAGVPPSIEVNLAGPLSPAGADGPGGSGNSVPEAAPPPALPVKPAAPSKPPVQKTIQEMKAAIIRPESEPGIDVGEATHQAEAIHEVRVARSPIVGEAIEQNSDGDAGSSTYDTAVAGGSDGAVGGGAVSGTGTGLGGRGDGVGQDGYLLGVAKYPPAYGYNPKPDYPRAARQAGQQGTVTLLVEALASGRPGKITVAHSSGHKLLDDAAADAVRKWRFVPAKTGARPMSAWVKIPIEFNLKD